MLKNEPEEPLAQTPDLQTPAAQIRVTPEELAAALNTLEADKQAAARHREGTVPIGQVVQEMGLDATPEEVWAQVQRQRQAAAEKASVPPQPPLHQAARAAAQAVAAAK